MLLYLISSHCNVFLMWFMSILALYRTMHCIVLIVEPCYTLLCYIVVLYLVMLQDVKSDYIV